MLARAVVVERIEDPDEGDEREEKRGVTGREFGVLAKDAGSPGGGFTPNTCLVQVQKA